MKTDYTKIMTSTEKIQTLYEDIKCICISHRCDKWQNSWMWDNTQSRSKLIYHHLITIDTRELNYRDIDNYDITLKYEQYLEKYRIDIRNSRYDQHNFWLFDDKKFLIVETYIKEIIQYKYNTLQKINNLINLSNDAYYEKEPINLYNEINIKLRSKKLNKINQTR